MNLMFVAILASGSVLYQPQSKENCAKLVMAFANGAKVTATIEGREIPILQGACIKLDQADQLQQPLSAVQNPPMS